jgi:hypothetical protein
MYATIKLGCNEALSLPGGIEEESHQSHKKKKLQNKVMPGKRSTLVNGCRPKTACSSRK